MVLAPLWTACTWIGPAEFERRLDLDGDGEAAAVWGGTDCDDGDPGVHPSALEVCNGRDDDCDGGIDNIPGLEVFEDFDEDGFGDTLVPLTVDACEAPEGTSLEGGDCDDHDPDRWPGAPDLCDEIDQDCDGDAGLGQLDCPASSCLQIHEASPTLPSGTYYLDPEGFGAQAFTCEMVADGGGWTQLVDHHYDAGDPCPYPWVHPVTLAEVCVVPAASPDQGFVSFSEEGIVWRDIRIEATLRQSGAPDAFLQSEADDPTGFGPQDPYVDGLVVFTEEGSFDAHLWTYAVGASAGGLLDLAALSMCPPNGAEPPTFVDDDWICASAEPVGPTLPSPGWKAALLFDGVASVSTLPGSIPLGARPVVTRLHAIRENGSTGEDVGVQRLLLQVR